MAQGSSTVPPPPTDTIGVGVPEGDSTKDQIRQVISRLSGGGTPAVDAALQQHYARQKAQADLAGGQMQQVARAYAAEQDPQKKQALAHQWEVAKENYLKTVGKDKNAKGIAQKTLGVIEHIAGHQPPAAGQPAKQGQQTVPPPPQGAAASASPQPTVPPPPGAQGQGVPWQLEAMGAPERNAEMDRQNKTSEEQSKTDIASKARMDEARVRADISAKSKMQEEQTKIHEESVERLAQEEAKHRDKMSEIDETAKVKPPRPVAAGRAAGAKGPKESSEQVAANKSADLADTDFATAQERLANPTPVGDTGIVLSWVRSQIRGGGRINNTEIQSLLKSGKLETRFNNAYQRAINGTLDPQFRKQMVDDIGTVAKTARATADKYKQPADPRAKVPPPPSSTPQKIKVSAEDMANAGR
jgi:hypothetical protein